MLTVNMNPAAYKKAFVLPAKYKKIFVFCVLCALAALTVFLVMNYIEYVILIVGMVLLGYVTLSTLWIWAENLVDGWEKVDKR